MTKDEAGAAHRWTKTLDMAKQDDAVDGRVLTVREKTEAVKDQWCSEVWQRASGTEQMPRPTPEDTRKAARSFKKITGTTADAWHPR